MENVQFINWRNSTSFCGYDQRIFRVNPTNSDYIAPMKWTSTTFNNVEDSAVAYLENSPLEWANPDKCGSFPCTGHDNVLMEFEKTTFTGAIVPKRTADSF